MPTFRIDLRDAKPTNGHTGEPALTLIAQADAKDWLAARESAARRYGIDVYDPAMRVTEAEVPEPLEDAPSAPAKRKRARRA